MAPFPPVSRSINSSFCEKRQPEPNGRAIPGEMLALAPERDHWACAIILSPGTAKSRACFTDVRSRCDIPDWQ